MVSDPMDFDSLYGRHEGETIVVAGTSGSLNELDLGILSGFTIIGTNDALGRFATTGLPIPKYLLTADMGATSRAMIDLKEHPEVSLITRRRMADRVRSEGFEGDIYLYDLTTKSSLPALQGSFKQSNNTAHYAVQAAARMRGVDKPGRIVLIGVDLRYPTEEEEAEGKKDHYWGEGKVDGCKPNFTSAIQFFPNIAKWLRGRGIELVTASPWDGPLTQCLPRVSLEDISIS